MRNCFLLLLLLAAAPAFAQQLTGIVTDQQGQRLPYASIQVRGRSEGATANAEGRFTLKLPQGTYTVTCQHVGFQQQEQTITVADADQELRFRLPQQQLTLSEVVVQKGEDPAYEIIRQAIRKRKDHRDELRRFTTQVYTKGQLRLRNYPKKFLGEKVDFEDGDTSKHKMLYFSETVARYSVEPPRHVKVEVVATKVSGQNDGFGLSAPRIFTLYDNLVSMGSGFNPRGFVSPISDNALHYYKYRYEGAFTENGRMINRIRVTPKRRYEPLFQGYIQVVEDEWRVHSIDLTLVKEYGLQTLDTLRLQQLWIPAGSGPWVLQSQVLYPAVKFLGFDAHGSFVNVYSDYELDPKFPKGYFDNTVLKYNDSSNKKPEDYWSSTRPMALQQDEIADYRKKDSLERLRNSPAYLDSIDRLRNKLDVSSLVLTGQVFSSQKNHTTLQVRPLLETVKYNTVEGLVLHPSVTFTQRIDTQALGRRYVSVSPSLRYGFSNRHFNPSLRAVWSVGRKYARRLELAGGSDVFQFNNDNPVSELVNTFATLTSKTNPLKIYEARFARVGYSHGMEGGLVLSGALQYQDRIPLENTTSWVISGDKGRSFTPNYPVPAVNGNITRHQVATASVHLRWQPGTRYVQFPNARINIGSQLPVLGLGYTRTLGGLLGSDLRFSKWDFTLAHSVNLRLGGRMQYQLGLGGFLDRDSVQSPDFHHFRGTATRFVESYGNRFQLVGPYQLSNASRFYSFLFFEHHFNGLLTNKIPLIRKLKWNLVAGANALYYAPGRHYVESFVGLENILRLFRIDYIYGIEDNGQRRDAIRFGFARSIFGRN